MRVTKAITINRPIDEVYAFWRDFENLPRFMYHLQMVDTIGEKRSHWTAKGPADTSVEWDAEIVEERPNEIISWRSIGANDEVSNAGSVRFLKAPGDRGTEIIVTAEYDLPGGKLGALFAKLFGEEPSQQIGEDLRRFKQVMEVGEVVRSDGSPEGQGRSIMRQHPAQPLGHRAESEARL
jgi:uncharacterized membrane protein